MNKTATTKDQDGPVLTTLRGLRKALLTAQSKVEYLEADLWNAREHVRVLKREIATREFRRSRRTVK